MTEGITYEDRLRMGELVRRSRERGEAIRKAADPEVVRKERLREEPVFEYVSVAINALQEDGRSVVSVREVADMVPFEAVRVGRVLTILSEDGDLELVSPNHPRKWRIQR